jgi:hypothetical protein
MKVISTGDVSLDELNKLIPELGPEIDLEVNRSQYEFRSFEPPSWVKFLAGSEWWIQLVVVSAGIFGKKIVEKAAEDTWNHRGEILESLKSGGGTCIRKLATGIAKLRERLPNRTRINIGIPVPSDLSPSTIELASLNSEDLEFEIGLFAIHQSALSALIKSEGLDQGRLLGSLRFDILDDGSLQVSWMDSEIMAVVTRKLPLVLPPADV